MAFSDLELQLIDIHVGGFCRRESPAEHADQLRFVYEVEGHAVSIYEERPLWDGREGPWTRLGVARFRYVRARNEWLLYWMRRDGKWHRYEDAGPTADLVELIAIVDRDPYCAFFG